MAKKKKNSGGQRDPGREANDLGGGAQTTTTEGLRVAKNSCIHLKRGREKEGRCWGSEILTGKRTVGVRVERSHKCMGKGLSRERK